MPALGSSQHAAPKHLDGGGTLHPINNIPPIVTQLAQQMFIPTGETNERHVEKECRHPHSSGISRESGQRSGDSLARVKNKETTGTVLLSG